MLNKTRKPITKTTMSGAVKEFSSGGKSVVEGSTICSTAMTTSTELERRSAVDTSRAISWKGQIIMSGSVGQKKHDYVRVHGTHENVYAYVCVRVCVSECIS